MSVINSQLSSGKKGFNKKVLDGIQNTVQDLYKQLDTYETQLSQVTQILTEYTSDEMVQKITDAKKAWQAIKKTGEED